MAIFVSRQSGLWSDPNTWSLVDTSSYLDRETTFVISQQSSVRYSNIFNTPNITIDGIGIKTDRIANILPETFLLYNSSSLSVVVSASISSSLFSNIAGLTTHTNHGWIIASIPPTTLTSGTPYLIGVIGGANYGYVSSVVGYNWSRLLKLTSSANQIPNTEDIVHIGGIFNSPSSSYPIEVIYDNTGSFYYGVQSGSTGNPYSQSITINQYGTLTAETASNKNYLLQWRGPFAIFDSGSLNIGTEENPIHSSSNFLMFASCSSNVDSGLQVKTGATVNMYGYPFFTSSYVYLTDHIGGYVSTSGRGVTASYQSCQDFTGLTGSVNINNGNYQIQQVYSPTTMLLTTTVGTNVTPVQFLHTASSNVISVADTTGWREGDMIVIATTAQLSQIQNFDSRSIVSVDSPTQVTLNLPCTASHTGEWPAQAEVINLTRNLKFQGNNSASLCSYVDISNFTNVTCSQVEFFNLGSSTTNKRGIDIATATGSCLIKNCSIYNCVNTGIPIPINVTSTAGSNIFILNNCLWNYYRGAIQNVATTGVQTYDGNIAMYSADIAGVTYVTMNFLDAGGIYRNLTAIGNNATAGGTNTGYAIVISENNAYGTGIYENLIVHSCGDGIGISLNSCSINNCKGYRIRSTGVGIDLGSGAVSSTTMYSGIKSSNLLVFGNALFGVSDWAPFSTITNLTSSSDPVFTQLSGYLAGSIISPTVSTHTNKLIKCCFGASGEYFRNNSRDIGRSDNRSSYRLYLDSCQLNSSTEVVFPVSTATNTTFNYPGLIWILSQNHDGIVGNHKTMGQEGTIIIDTTIYRTESPSMRMIPATSGSNIKLTPGPIGILIPINSGSTITPSVYVRKSTLEDGVLYNGNEPRLVLKENYALGYTGNIILASTTPEISGSWELLTGTTPPAQINGIAEVIVDCDGSTGWVNVDDFQNNTKLDSKTFKYWNYGLPSVNPDNPVGSTINISPYWS